MTASEEEPLDGFYPTGRTFFLTGSDLKAWRGYSRQEIGEEWDRDFSISVTGLAVGDVDDVCVIGTDKRSREFRLSIRSDFRAKKNWEWIKGNDISLFKFESDTPERRLKIRKNERLEESPPTATLFISCADYDDWRTDDKDDWALECQVPDAALEQLVSDIIAQRVNTVRIGIAWEVGLIKDERMDERPWHSGTTWGLMKLSEEARPENMDGHVTHLGWELLTESGNSQRSKCADLSQMREEKDELTEPDRIQPRLAQTTLNFNRATFALWAIAIGVLLNALL